MAASVMRTAVDSTFPPPMPIVFAS